MAVGSFVSGFGGKKRVVDVGWEALGDLDHYSEPFVGGGSMLFNRPAWHKPVTGSRVETINDAWGFVSNAYRSIQANPEEVARHCDHPNSEVDILAWQRWLCDVQRKPEFLQRMAVDPTYYDPLIAGRWIWGQNAWIGNGWCLGVYDPQDPERDHSVHTKIPHLDRRGANRETDVLAYLRRISDRLKKTRIACGDWTRVCTEAAWSHFKAVGFFFDPPYAQDNDNAPRRADLYGCEKVSTKDIELWCKEAANRPGTRIVLAGREGEYDLPRWRVHAWSSHRPYATRTQEDDGERTKERLWLSPQCLPVGKLSSGFSLMDL